MQKFWEIDMKGVNMQNWNVIKLEIPKIKFYIKMKEKDKKCKKTILTFVDFKNWFLTDFGFLKTDFQQNSAFEKLIFSKIPN